jgi:hypothetical protein
MQVLQGLPASFQPWDSREQAAILLQCQAGRGFLQHELFLSLF